MSRPTDWHPLATSDPVPGDPYQVQLLGKKLRDVADAIDEQTNKLKTMCSDGYWDSDAAKVFDETAQKTATSLHKAYDRWDTAASAIQTYQPVLEHQQSVSLTLLTQAQELEHTKNLAQQRLDADEAAAKAAPPPPADAPPTPERPGAAGDRSTVGDYASQLKALQDKVQDCADAVREAAKTASNNIHDSADHDGLKDHWWDDVKAWIHDHADIISTIADIAGWVATACGIAALLVGWIPIIGQAIAAVLTAVALVATVVSLVCHLALLFSGDGGLLDVVLDVVGILTLGVGSAAVSGLKGGLAAFRASGKLAKAAETMGGAIVAKGGRMTPEVMNALGAAKFSEAASLSNLRASTLKGMMGNRLGGLHTAFGDGGFKALQNAMGAAPGGLFPRAADFAAGFKPGTLGDVFKDGWDGAKTLKNAGWGNSLTALKNGFAHPGNFSFAPADIAASIRDTKGLTNGLDTSSLSAANAALRSQLHFNVGSIATFTGIDLTDKFHGFDAGKDFGSDWGNPGK